MKVHLLDNDSNVIHSFNVDKMVEDNILRYKDKLYRYSDNNSKMMWFTELKVSDIE